MVDFNVLLGSNVSEAVFYLLRFHVVISVVVKGWFYGVMFVFRLT